MSPYELIQSVTELSVAAIVVAVAAQGWAVSRLLTWRFVRRHLDFDRRQKLTLDYRADCADLLRVLRKDDVAQSVEESVRRYRIVLLNMMVDEHLSKRLLRDQLDYGEFEIDPEKLNAVHAMTMARASDLVRTIDDLKQDGSLMDRMLPLKKAIVFPHIKGEVRQFGRILHNELSDSARLRMIENQVDAA